MNKLICNALAALAVLAAGCATATADMPRSNELSEADHAAALALAPGVQIADGGLDFLCTVSCSFWNVCRAENLGNPLACGTEPPGCCCTTFSDC